MRAPSTPAPYAPYLEKVRAWLEERLRALRFVEIVVAILALIARMRDANTELVTKLAHLKRKRPPSETLERIERQLALPLFGEQRPPKKPRSKASRVGRHPGRAALPGH